MANEVAVSGKTEEQINAFLDKIADAMLATVKSGLSVKEGVLPGPIKLQSKAATVWERAQDDKYESDRAIAHGLRLRPGRLGRERPRPPGHHRAHGRLGGRDARDCLCPRREQAEAAHGKGPRGPARRRGDRLLVQTQRDPLRRRGRLPVRDRRRLGHDRRVHRPGHGQLAAGHRERRRVGARTSPRHDL